MLEDIDRAIAELLDFLLGEPELIPVRVEVES